MYFKYSSEKVFFKSDSFLIIKKCQIEKVIKIAETKYQKLLNKKAKDIDIPITPR